MSEGKLERSTPLLCKQCRAAFEARNRNGKQKEFCSRRCKDRYGNTQRLQAVASINHKKPRNHRGPSKHAQRVSQTVVLALVPIEERAELLRLAAANLGITDRDRIEAALRRAGIPHYEATA